MAKRFVTGRVVFAEAGDPPAPGLEVAAFDIDPIRADDPLGDVVLTTSTGDFSIEYDSDASGLWIFDRKPDIEVRVYGPGKRVLWQSGVREDVDFETLLIPVVRIHRTNIRTSAPDDPSWLVCHTSLDSASGTPIRLTTGNQIEWLIDGAKMFPAVTDALEGAQSSIRFMNLNFYIRDLMSKFDPENVVPNSTVTVSRIERILKRKAKDGKDVHVIVWELANITDLLVLLFNKTDTADEVRAYFKDTPAVRTSSFESSELLHIKLAVIDGTSAFVIGSTVSRTYFADDRHSIRDPRHGERELIHDMSLGIKGPAVRHVDETFTTIWNVGPLAPVISPAPMPGPATTAGGSVQMLRTMPGEIFKKDPPNLNDPAHLPFGETGILEAYQRAIMKAEEYIYIEDQYLVSQEIVDALILRMKENDSLEVIFLLNVKPDIAGYHRKQAALLKQLHDSLPETQRHRLGIFTIWSHDHTQGKLEIAHIYVHSKLAIIDDKWATVGTANLDGASLNRRQYGLIFRAVLAERLDSLIRGFKNLGLEEKIVVALVGPLMLAVTLITFAPLLLLAGAVGVTFSLPTLVGFVFTSLLKETAHETQHANPNSNRQPPRHPELNLVLYEGIAGQPSDPDARKAVELRRALWREHLGHESPLTRPPNGWLSEWRDAAKAYKEELQAVARPINPVPAVEQTIKVLEWVPDPKPVDYLRALDIETDNLTIRDRGVVIPFKPVEKDPEPDDPQ